MFHIRKFLIPLTTILIFSTPFIKAEEEEILFIGIIDQIQVITKDLNP